MGYTEGYSIRTGRKQAASFLAAVLLLLLLFSVTYIAVEKGHQCDHNHCPVCASIELCEKTVRQLGGGFAVPAGAAAFCILILCALTAERFLCIFSTPVTRRVRLNN